MKKKPIIIQTPPKAKKQNPRGTISIPNQKKSTQKCKKKAKNVKNLVEKKRERQKRSYCPKKCREKCLKTPSINKKIVPVINMFKMLPQAKYKIVTENNPPPPFNSFKRAKCYPNQKIKSIIKRRKNKNLKNSR